MIFIHELCIDIGLNVDAPENHMTLEQNATEKTSLCNEELLANHVCFTDHSSSSSSPLFLLSFTFSIGWMCLVEVVFS